MVRVGSFGEQLIDGAVGPRRGDADEQQQQQRGETGLLDLGGWGFGAKMERGTYGRVLMALSGA